MVRFMSVGGYGRAKRQFELWRVVFWLIAAFLTWILGTIGFWQAQSIHTGWSRFLEASYHSFQLFKLESVDYKPRPIVMIDIARWLALMVTATAILKLFAVVLRELLDEFKLKRYRGHDIICGLGWKARLLIRRLRDEGRQVVVIEKDENNPVIESCRTLGAHVIVGDATQPEILLRAGIGRARRLVCLADDMANIEMSVAAEKALASLSRAKAPDCFVHIEDSLISRTLYERQFTELAPRLFRDYFSVFEIGATEMLSSDQFRPFRPGPDGKAPHLLIVGLDSMGQSLVLETVYQWSKQNANDPLHITVFDPQADEKVDSLQRRYKDFSRFCVLNPRNWRSNNADHSSEIKLDQTDYSVAFVCTLDEKLALDTALTLYHQRAELGKRFPIVVQLMGNQPLGELFVGDPKKEGLEEFFVFNLFNQTCQPEHLDSVISAIARGIHEHYLAQQSSKSKQAAKPWKELPAYLKEGNRLQAVGMPGVLKAATKRLYRMVPLSQLSPRDFPVDKDDLEEMAIAEHERYVAAKKATNVPAVQDWALLSEENKEKTRQQVRDWPEILFSQKYEIISYERNGG